MKLAYIILQLKSPAKNIILIIVLKTLKILKRILNI